MKLSLLCSWSSRFLWAALSRDQKEKVLTGLKGSSQKASIRSYQGLIHVCAASRAQQEEIGEFLGEQLQVDLYPLDQLLQLVATVPNSHQVQLSREEQLSLLKLLSMAWPLLKEDPAIALSLPNQDFLRVPKDIKAEVSLYPGSFNPFHEGHLQCIKASRQRPLIVIPDLNPWKEVQVENPLLHFLQIAKKLTSLEHVFLYPGFLALEEKNPTCSWISRIQSEKITFVMGSDSFCDLPKWKNFEAIIHSLNKIEVIPRGDLDKETQRVKEDLLKISPQLKILIHSHHPYEEVSSTQKRELLSKE